MGRSMSAANCKRAVILRFFFNPNDKVTLFERDLGTGDRLSITIDDVSTQRSEAVAANVEIGRRSGSKRYIKILPYADSRVVVPSS